MARYHITKKGNPGICKAKVKCPLGDMTTEHYDSKETARAAFEASKKADSLVSISKSKKNSLSVEKKSPISNIISEEVSEQEYLELVNEWGDDLYVGEYSISGNNSAPSQEEAVELVSEFLDENGCFSPPQDFLEEDEVGEREPVYYGRFRLLGSGYSKNAYLDEDSMLVYKLPNSQSCFSGWNSQESIDQNNMMILDQKAYAGLDDEVLSSQGYEYVKTYFLRVEDGNGDSVPVVVQPFLGGEEYSSVEVSLEEERRLNKEFYLDDLKSANIRRRVSDGKIILFDCLDYWGED